MQGRIDLRDLERRDGIRHLARDIERLTAAGEHADRGRRAQDPVGELGAGIHQVLAIIEHDEKSLPVQIVAQHVNDRPLRLLPQTDRRGDDARQ